MALLLPRRGWLRAPPNWWVTNDGRTLDIDLLNWRAATDETWWVSPGASLDIDFLNWRAAEMKS